jgi:hypothetical protein
MAVEEAMSHVGRDAPIEALIREALRAARSRSRSQMGRGLTGSSRSRQSRPWQSRRRCPTWDVMLRSRRSSANCFAAPRNRSRSRIGRIDRIEAPAELVRLRDGREPKLAVSQLIGTPRSRSSHREPTIACSRARPSASGQRSMTVRAVARRTGASRSGLPLRKPSERWRPRHRDRRERRYGLLRASRPAPDRRRYRALHGHMPFAPRLGAVVAALPRSHVPDHLSVAAAVRPRIHG